MALSPSKDSFVVPEMEDISPSGVWSYDEGGSSSISADIQCADSTPKEEATVKDEKPSWPFKRFTELAKSAKGRVTQGMLQFIRKHLKGTRLIFVVGLSGSGKTTFLAEITNQKLNVGHSATSGTLGYEVLPAIVHGEQYLFVDTPGFGAEDLDDKDVYEDIMSCVRTLGQWVTIAGIMFVHDMRAQRLTKSEMKTIRWLQCFCGPQFFENITVVLTQWDRITKCDMDQTRDIAKQFETAAFRGILSPEHAKGGRVYYHEVKMSDEQEWDVVSMKERPEERSSMAADFIRDHYEHSAEIAELQVLEELSKGWGIYETQAAVSLFNTFSSSTICVLRRKALILDIDEELKPKIKEVERAAAPRPVNETADADVRALRWWEIAKEVAWTYWGFRRSGNTKFTEYRQSTPADAWEKLKTWWSGERPPQ